MHLLLDFTRPAPPSPGGMAAAAAEMLLACFQEALGHQLPNHLVALQGLARLLQADAGDRLGPDGREQLDRLAALAQQTDRLVRALAEVGRLCRDARSAHAVDVADVAREAAAEVNVLCPGHPVGYDFPQALPPVRVSRPSLRQALVQLLRNAAASGEPSRPATVRVGGRVTETGGVEVWVADDGRGLPEGPSERLFAPFGRPAGGAGLGLFLVRQLVACWGGVLRVDSEPGKGTRVGLLL
jgi:signal transduction histidine kinase